MCVLPMIILLTWVLRLIYIGIMGDPDALIGSSGADYIDLADDEQ